MASLAVISYLAAGCYALSVTVLACYGLHSLWLLGLFLRHRRAAEAEARREAATPLPPDAELPRVLVQLPVFNERDVVCRLVEAIGRLDWPADKLVIQLLDDSTDDSVEIGRIAVAGLRARGLDAVSLHRADRTGFKAGALSAGMERDDAPFIAIFDADFIPNPDFLKIAVKPLLADPGLALVQGRWDHLNRDDNLLTRAQALGIDGHFAIEQGARAWSGLAMNFNGTCGLWRRAAILDGGGWEHDTLTEDMDLSYRAQLKGWRCTYRLGLAVPGEVPATLSAWRSQQFRWAKGSIQTALKLLPRVWRSPWSLHRKLAATLHMTHYAVHPLILVSLICAPPTMMLARWLPGWMLGIGLIGFAVGSGAPLALYGVSQWVLAGREGLRRLRILPALAGIGTGIAMSNTRAVWEAVIGRQSAFVRTPKQGFGKGSYKAGQATGIPELLCAAWAGGGLLIGLRGARSWIAPLMVLYISGFVWVGWFTLRERLAGFFSTRVPSRSPLAALVPLALASAAGYAWLGRAEGGWREQPAQFALVALALGALYLTAVAAVRRRAGGPWTLAWIGAAALAFRVICLVGIAPAPDASRAVFEGRQLAAGQDPYRVAPLAARAQQDVDHRLAPSIAYGIDEPRHPATTPPLGLVAESLVADAGLQPRDLKAVAAVAEALCLLMVLALMVRFHLPAGLVVAAAWNPLGPLLAAGEGHLEALAALLLVGGCSLAAAGHRIGSTVTATCAALVRPLTAPALVPLIAGRRLRAWLLPLAVIAAAYAPFLAHGLAPVAGLGRLVSALPFHGALSPVLRVLVAPWVGYDQVQPLVAALLAALLAGGLWLLAQRRELGEPSSAQPRDMAFALALLLACLPSFRPEFALPLVALLPFTRSWGLLAWTAAAPLYWLHGPAGGEAGYARELPWVTALAHLPALAIVAWELALHVRRAIGRTDDDLATQPV